MHLKTWFNRGLNNILFHFCVLGFNIMSEIIKWYNKNSPIETTWPNTKMQLQKKAEYPMEWNYQVNDSIMDL